jgi:hypothetical protein
MHNWHLGWFCSLYFRYLQPAACKTTWDCWNYPVHMHKFYFADYIQESSDMGLLEPCGPNYHCSLYRDRTSSHSGLFINPKTQWLSTVVWGFPCDFFLPISCFWHSLSQCECLLFVNPTNVFWKYLIILLSHVPHTWSLTQVSDSDYVCSRLCTCTLNWCWVS